LAGQLRETPPEGQLRTYQDGTLSVQVRIGGQTVWLTQSALADLYQISVPTVNEHLSNIYADGELGAPSTIRKFRIVQLEGHDRFRASWTTTI
jgi:hypothetical protein